VVAKTKTRRSKVEIKFYQAPILPFGCMVFYEYDKKTDERYFCDVITKIYHDKPLSFEKMCIENVLVSLFDLLKKFDDELTLIKWLIDNHFTKIFGNDEYEIYKNSLHYNNRMDIKVNYNIPIYAVYRKNTPPQDNREVA
jgi:hypothetical protein